MTFPMILIFLATCVGGAVIQTVSGFGFGIFAMTIFPYLFPRYTGAVAVSCLLALSNTSVCTFRMRQYINWKQVLIPMAGYTLTSFLCITFSNGRDAFLMKALGVILILMSLYFLFLNGKIHIRPTVLNGILAGSAGGVLSGLFGMGGPPMVIYLLAVTDNNNEYMATIQAYFAVGGVISAIVRIMNGIITWSVIPFWILGTLAVAAGIRIGSCIFKKLNAVTLRKCIYSYMIFSGIVMFFR